MGTQIGGDFIGFSFGSVHSSTLGIVRVSDGSRYNENLLPTFQDKTVQVPGADGMYYFGSYYTQRQFNISIAYDSLTEDQIRQIRQTFGNKEPQKLIFDETPYKFYWAKCTGTPSLKFICFSDPPQDSEDIQVGRLYKGEGTLTFVCHDPFAYSVSRWVKGIENKTDLNAWKTASGLLGDGTELSNPWAYSDKNATLVDTSGVRKIVEVENNGDMEADWLITVNRKSGLTAGKIGVTILAQDSNGNNIGEITVNDFDFKGLDVKVKIISKSNLIQGATNSENTSNVYNEYMTGSFFKLPLGKTTFTITPNANTHVEVIKFHYKYY